MVNVYVVDYYYSDDESIDNDIKVFSQAEDAIKFVETLYNEDVDKSESHRLNSDVHVQIKELIGPCC